jgi:hypothetical protein
MGMVRGGKRERGIGRDTEIGRHFGKRLFVSMFLYGAVNLNANHSINDTKR